MISPRRVFRDEFPGLVPRGVVLPPPGVDEHRVEDLAAANLYQGFG